MRTYYISHSPNVTYKLTQRYMLNLGKYKTFHGSNHSKKTNQNKTKIKYLPIRMPNSSPPTSFTECMIWPRSNGILKEGKHFPTPY